MGEHPRKSPSRADFSYKDQNGVEQRTKLRDYVVKQLSVPHGGHVVVLAIMPVGKVQSIHDRDHGPSGYLANHACTQHNNAMIFRVNGGQPAAVDTCGDSLFEGA